MLPSLPPGAQSLEAPWEFRVVQERPERAPRSHTPDPTAPGAPVAVQRGHGCAALPVKKTCCDSMTFAVVAPLTRFTVPVAGAAKVFTAQAESDPFGMGSGAPNAHPVLVQSKSGDDAVVGPSGQEVRSESTQPRSVAFSEKWFTAPSGSGVSGIRDAPPPIARSPHGRSRTSPPLPLRVTPQLPSPATLANSTVSGRSGGRIGGAVVVVVLVDDVVVELAVVLVVATGVEVVVEPDEHGLGVHGPGPRSAPPAVAHWPAVSSLQMNAPTAEPGRQHRMDGAAVVLVEDEVVVTVVEVEVVVTGPVPGHRPSATGFRIRN